MQNNWKTRDPGRSRARSDGREKLATWPASQAFELAANRRVRWYMLITRITEVVRVELMIKLV